MGAFDFKQRTPAICDLARLFATSQNFTTPASGLYRIDNLGAGGGGGNGQGTGASDNASASGGGGGGFCSRDVWLNQGDILTITIGLGGIATGGAPIFSTSTVGGTTSVIGAGVAMYAFGGGGGVGGNTATLRSGGVGGGAIGGEINYKGGDGGDSTASIAGSAAAAGGGSSGSPYGNGYKGGSPVTGGFAQACGTGAGIAQAGLNTAGSGSWNRGGGTCVGGTQGNNAMNIASAQSPYAYGPTPNLLETLWSPHLPLWCLQGGSAPSTSQVGPGAGGGVSSGGVGNPGGVCGGGGGLTYTASIPATPGVGSVCGGGGGGLAAYSSSAAGTPARGGPGLVVIQRIG